VKAKVMLISGFFLTLMYQKVSSVIKDSFHNFENNKPKTYKNICNTVYLPKSGGQLPSTPPTWVPHSFGPEIISLLLITLMFECNGLHLAWKLRWKRKSCWLVFFFSHLCIEKCPVSSGILFTTLKTTNQKLIKSKSHLWGSYQKPMEVFFIQGPTCCDCNKVFSRYCKKIGATL
jgi:hypothetical protein